MKGQLLAMSFDVPSSPSIRLHARRDWSQGGATGWGFAWYPRDDLAGVVIKDPNAVSENDMRDVLSDWDRFRSSTFVCHVRGAAKRVRQQDTQPFWRSYSGRDLILAQSGDLRGDPVEALPLGEHPMFQPIGRTDTERMLCWLLERMNEIGARRLRDIGWSRLQDWLTQLDALGSATLLLSDGSDLVVHAGADEPNQLHWHRRLPPHAQTLLKGPVLDLDLGDTYDLTRTALIFASTPLDGSEFHTMTPGQTLVASSGALRWSSTGDVDQLMTRRAVVSAEVSAWTEVGIAVNQQDAQTVAPSASNGTDHNAGNQTMPPPAQVGPSWSAATSGARVLTIRHVTSYNYSEDVERSSHLLRLQPVHDRHQEILEHSLEVAPMDGPLEFDDVFGNTSLRFKVSHPYRQMTIAATSRVRILPSGAHLPARRENLPLVWMPWQRQMMMPYLLPPELPETQLRELSEYAKSFVRRQDRDLVATVTDINDTIYRDFRYLSGSTTLETTPFDVYTRREGVCQDFANLFICMARLLGIPARYRVGYIFTGANYENKVQSEASHAWLELYLPWVGWRGFDPTNGCLVALDHIRVAAGRNYRDATPTSGTLYKGGGTETLSVEVRVEQG